MKSFADKVIYQIYVKSFHDSNGDGIGDLNGIRQKLSYLKELDVDLLWLNPFYPSPQKDNGYDIKDYKGVDPLFGTMSDFESLVNEAEQMGMGVMLDMVLNHTSIHHPWFQKALAGNKKYQDYYILRKPKENGDLPTNWPSKFGGPAWEPFGKTGNYYLHLYDVSQADLNWRNPEVRRELYDVIKFWMNKGVKGFRFDVINVIGKDVHLEDAIDGVGKYLYTDRPIAHKYIHEMNEETYGKDPNIVTVGEMSSTTIQNGVRYSAPENEELSMIFSFHHLKVDYDNGEKWSVKPFDFAALKSVMNEWQEGMAKGNGWNALFWNNHDQPRANDRFGDPKKYPYETATLLAQTIHLLRGTPFIYQGEEIGMKNPSFDRLSSYRDVETLNAYQELKEKGMSEEEIMDILRTKSRDNSRTPMQWTKGKNAGFSTGTPWIAPAASYHDIYADHSKFSQKVFCYYQKLIQLRKTYPVISEGDYHIYDENHPKVYAYMRQWKNQTLFVINHFYGESTSIDIPDSFLTSSAAHLIGNYPEQQLTKKILLRPYETVAWLLTE